MSGWIQMFDPLTTLFTSDCQMRAEMYKHINLFRDLFEKKNPLSHFHTVMRTSKVWENSKQLCFVFCKLPSLTQ